MFVFHAPLLSLSLSSLIFLSTKSIVNAKLSHLPVQFCNSYSTVLTVTKKKHLPKSQNFDFSQFHPPVATAQGSKKKKGNKPPYMTDEQWALANNIVQLVDNLRGPSSENSVACTISRAQAGIYLRQLIYPKKNVKEKEEAVGASAVEVALRLMKVGDSIEKAIAAGVLQSLTQVPTGLTTLMDVKPPPYAAIWNGVGEGTTSLATASLGLMRNICENPEYKYAYVFFMIFFFYLHTYKEILFLSLFFSFLIHLPFCWTTYASLIPELVHETHMYHPPPPPEGVSFCGS